jgi:hypothetical protein
MKISSWFGRTGGVLLLAGSLTTGGGTARTAALPEFDFTRAAVAREWRAAHDIAALRATPAGLEIELTGGDPYFYGPLRDYPTNTPLWLELTLKSETGGGGQVFYFRDGAPPTESNSARFSVPAGKWHTARLRLPALGPGWRLRVDPPGRRGRCWIRSLGFAERVLLSAPDWPAVPRPDWNADGLLLESGELRLRHARDRFNAFTVEVAGRPLASGNPAGLIGYVRDGQVRWVALGGTNAQTRVTLTPGRHLADRWLGGNLRASTRFTDPDGGVWEAEQTFVPDQAGALRVSVRLGCDQPRELLYVPVFMLFTGLDRFGVHKTQALLPGIEYLADEPSSSTADLNPPASRRQVPDLEKLTFPLMALAAEGRWVALTWACGPAPEYGVVFDSPDRLFHSGGSVMGVLFPGSNGENREADSLLPYGPVRRRGSLRWEGLILGGRGATVVPAVQRYVRLNGLPALPEPAARDYYRLAARGWLDSAIREGNRFRHAVGPGFSPIPAADAAVWMEWLARKVDDPPLARRLRETARDVIAAVPPGERNTRQVGHVRPALPALVYGGVAAAARQAATHVRRQLRRFAPDGSLRYQRVPGKPDYARTHWSREANGLTAKVVHSLLNQAAFCGDEALIAAGLERLRGLDKFRDTVPRGAQTWEIPLHTPDILAAGHLVGAYVLGYELSGDPAFLEQARYWAWTGVPFVYLRPPTPGPVGLYGTIAVLGATHWVAPVWIGLPVQWCGLVYADALQRLARHDPKGPWARLAAGIARSGIEQTWPADDPERVGLLPDSFSPKTQTRNNPAINPATVLVPAIPALGEPVPYDFVVSRRHQWRVHAPGPISDFVEDADGIRFRVAGWPEQPWRVLVNGVHQSVKIRVNDAPPPPATVEPHRAEGWLILTLTAPARIEIRRERP